MAHKARTRSRQTPLSCVLLAAVQHVNPAAFSSLCLVFSLLLFNTSTQQPSVLSVLCSPCCCSTRQPSSLQFSLSCVLLAAVQHVNPAAFSSLCLVFSLLLFNTSTQQPSVLLPFFVATLFLACLFFCFLLALFLLAGRCSSCRHDQAMSTFSGSGICVVVMLLGRVWCWRWPRTSTLSVSSLGRYRGIWKVFWCLGVSCASTVNRRGAQRGHCSGRF